jgi:hypothetical protein
MRLPLSKGPPPLHLRKETDPVSETDSLVFLEYRTMDKVQKPIVRTVYNLIVHQACKC